MAITLGQQEKCQVADRLNSGDAGISQARVSLVEFPKSDADHSSRDLQPSTSPDMPRLHIPNKTTTDSDFKTARHSGRKAATDSNPKSAIDYQTIQPVVNDGFRPTAVIRVWI
ncbi:hypothetical protein [Methylomonas sp. LWB]|uniref:hypothetical protein n=1 Tax=Methylomonas sp. LWB TaxID=1905845 RepID=UPI0011153AE9|nr:hypothetical protein [Methylomonas sp. LWB]